ncbi:MAG TPA: hypothetical protein VL360_06765 [Gammaproteobacteria bacterium]|jgi:hypothetical protein|nr:hypothetical protein [Gammaproteobacteria bacterium]
MYGLSGLFQSMQRLPQIKSLDDAKIFLCQKRGLSVRDARHELLKLNDMQAALLCRFYDAGLRGEHIRNLMDEFPNYLELSQTLMYPDGVNFNDDFIFSFTDITEVQHAQPVNALRLVLALADFYKSKNVTLDVLQEKCLDGICAVGGLTAHDVLILNHFLSDRKHTPAHALQKIADNDDDVIEMRMIESPKQRYCGI